jgi:PAS domain S-box-containing protein
VAAALDGVLEAVPAAVAIADLDGRILRRNEAFTRLNGWKAGESGTLAGSEIWSAVSRHLSRVLASRGTELVELPRHADTPGAVAVRCWVRALRGGDGSPVALSIVVEDAAAWHAREDAHRRVDVAALMLNEERLRRSEALLLATQRIARIGSWELDLSSRTEIDTNPLRWSDECYRVFGYEPGTIEVTNDLFWSRVHPDDRDRIQAAVRHAIETGSVYSIEHRIVLGDGTERIVLERAELIHEEKTGRPLKFIGTIQDITDRKMAEERLTELQKMEAVGRLAGGIAHDFNNLLTVILGYGGLLRSLLPEGSDVEVLVNEMMSAGNRAAALTRQLLAFSRRQVLRPRVLDLNETIAEMSVMLERLIGEHIDLRTTLRPGVYRVLVDPGQIEQVLMNLVVNAREAMPAGGRITIETGNVDLSEAACRSITELEPGPYAMIAVSDTGCGMDAETLAHVFDPFFTTRSDRGGTGLGLATVYGIVKQSLGHITVTSQPREGTVFTILLPRTAEPRGEPPDEPEKPTGGGSESILLVEDEDAVRRLTAEVLREAGYRVADARSGQAALELFHSHGERFDLLVTDVVMPGMSGRDLAHRLRGRQPGLPVLFLSGYTEEHDEVEPDLLLPKPFTTETLRRHVRAVLDRSSSSRRG